MKTNLKAQVTTCVKGAEAVRRQRLGCGTLGKLDTCFCGAPPSHLPDTPHLQRAFRITEW